MMKRSAEPSAPLRCSPPRHGPSAPAPRGPVADDCAGCTLPFPGHVAPLAWVLFERRPTSRPGMAPGGLRLPAQEGSPEQGMRLGGAQS